MTMPVMVAGESLAAAGDMGQIHVWRPAGQEEGMLPSLEDATWRSTNCT